MSENICNICGANYAYKDGKWVCPACGAYKQEELSNEEDTLLYNAAQKLRLNAFDDAEESYRDIVRRYPQNSSGYWGLVLAKYGIKYEQDYDGKMIPTCYAASYDSILGDKDYKRALDLASKDNRSYYETQAEKIERIRKEWVEKASHEPPFDIFLSYKDTELENGVDRTRDSYDAFELYAHLQALGYRVFYSRESLKGREGEKYEPYIFNALNTAHVMIVYGSKPEYVESTWIRNEWSRFYKRIKNEQKQSNALLVVFNGFSPSALPLPLNKMQNLDRNSPTFFGDLDAYVARVISAAKQTLPRIERINVKAKTRGEKKSQKARAEATVHTPVEKRELGGVQVSKLTASAENKLTVADMYLQRKQFDEAQKAYSDFLIGDKYNGRALIGKLLADVQCVGIEALTPNSLYTFEDWALLDKILHCAEKSDAEAVLRVLCTVAEQSVPANAARAKSICEQVCAYDLPRVARMRKSLFEFGLEQIASGSSEAQYFIDTALLYEQNGSDNMNMLRRVAESCATCGAYNIAAQYEAKLLDADETAYADYCLGVAKYAQSVKSFDAANEYYDSVLEIEPNSCAALFGKLCASICCEADDRLFEHIQDMTDFTPVEYWLGSVPENELTAQLHKLLSACEKHIASRKKGRDDIDKVAEKLLAYIPEKDDGKLIAWLKKLAAAFKENADFAAAQRFYAMAIAVDGEDHAAYWGLLQSKLKCKTDDDIIAQPEPLADHSEFQNALVASASNRAAMAHYIDVQGKQKEWAVQKEKKNKTVKKVKKITVITSVILAVLLMIGGAIGGWVTYYNSENRLKYTEVDGGYAICSGKFYLKNVSGKFTIPVKYNGKPIVEIADGAFEGFDKITEFVIPDTVTKIGARAFAKTGITEISLATNIEYVGADAFAGCKALKIVHVPERTELPDDWSVNWQNGNNAKIEYQIKVEYDYNGATFGTTQKSVYVVYGDPYTFAVPSRSGYVFDGWYRSEQRLTDGNGESISAWNYSDGGTVTAQWTANENTIIFNGNGATSGSMSAQKIKTDRTEKLSQNTFVRNGYTFAGWATSANGSKVYNDMARYTMGTLPSYTLYAVWTVKTNTVTFHANGGEGTMQPQRIATNASAKLYANTFTRSGYHFVGWATSANGSKEYDDGALYTMGGNENYDLYAVWESVFTYTEITYIGNIEITGYTGSDSNIKIPSSIDGKTVTSIGNGAFAGCSSLTSIEIPDRESVHDLHPTGNRGIF